MPVLSLNSRRILLELARSVIKTYCLTGDHVAFRIEEPELQVKRGCFVTLRNEGKLRGCVGTFDTHRFICDNVARMAVAAAYQDHRFLSVTKDEVDQIQIELFILGELEKVDSLDKIEIGKHGVYVKFGERSGTFLPDVAVEQKWSVPEFVTYCARDKAGLKPEECAKAEIFRYEVEKIKEEGMKGK